LRDKLREELPGILTWAVQGCLEWQIEGLNPPAKARAAVAAYREDSDPVAGFLAECCERVPEAETATAELHEFYKRWAETNGERPFGTKGLGSRLRQEFEPVDRVRKPGGGFRRGFRGVSLRRDA
jgi:putative DNA primase/helicase